MWLKRLLKLSNYGTGSGENGGAGGGIDVGSNFSTGVLPGQGNLFDEPPNREELYNARKRRQKQRMLERKRKWLLSRDRQRR